MKPELGISGRQHSRHAQGTSNGDTRQKSRLSQCQLYHFWALRLTFRPPACLPKQLFRDEASDSRLTMLLSGVERARPGLRTLWDLPAGGPQGNGAGTIQPELRLPAGRGGDGSHPQRWRNKLVGSSCSSPAPGASQHERRHPPRRLPGVLPPSHTRIGREQPHGSPRRRALPPRRSPMPEEPARGKPCQIPWGGARLPKAVGTLL